MGQIVNCHARPDASNGFGGQIQTGPAASPANDLFGIRALPESDFKDLFAFKVDVIEAR
jgi:hypothetical protein